MMKAFVESEYNRKVYAQNNYSFGGCYHRRSEKECVTDMSDRYLCKMILLKDWVEQSELYVLENTVVIT